MTVKAPANRAGKAGIEAFAAQPKLAYEGRLADERSSAIYSFEEAGLRYDFLWKPKPGSRRLFVLFSGDAVRSRFTPPVFQRWRWAESIPGHCVYFSDPALFLAEDLGLGWCAGTDQVDSLTAIARVVGEIAAQIGVRTGNIWSYGSSGGGFAALRFATALPGIGVVTINPQTDITRFRMPSVERCIARCFGDYNREEAMRLFPDQLSLLRHVEALAATRIVYAQNTLDEHHYADHYQPFCAAMGRGSEENLSEGLFRRLLFAESSGRAHPESPEVFVRLIEKVCYGFPRTGRPMQAPPRKAAQFREAAKRISFSEYEGFEGESKLRAKPMVTGKNNKMERKSYYSKRSHLIYYNYIDSIVRGLAYDARSMLDVGSHNADYLEAFDWIETRHALDIKSPYRSRSVHGIKADFLKFPSSNRYDFITCFQVLEHIEDVGLFAQKLMTLSDRVLVSVPYKWPTDSHWDHKHDNISVETLQGWFGREPDYRIVVREPLDETEKARRLIAYYHLGEKMPSFQTLRKRLRSRIRTDGTPAVDASSPTMPRGEERPVDKPAPTEQIDNVARTAGFRATLDQDYSKVFAIGFNKTGTTSIYGLLSDLGLAAKHGPRWRRNCESHIHHQFQAFTDGPPEDFRYLDAEFPGSKFILNVRDLGEWLDSRLEHIKFRSQDSSYGHKLKMDWSCTSEAVEIWIERRNTHHIQVMRHFATRPKDLLIVNFIRDAGAGSKISKFLGLPDAGVERPYLRSTPPTREAGVLRNGAIIDTALERLGVARDDLAHDILCPSLITLDARGGLPIDSAELTEAVEP